MPLTSVEERLFAGLAAQAGLVLRGARLRAELEPRADELSARAEELRALAPATGRRPGRRAPAPRARHPRRRAAAPRRPGGEPAPGPDPGRRGAGAGGRMLAGQEHAAAEAIDTLVQLSRGIYPRLLAERRAGRRARGGRHQPGPGRGHAAASAGYAATVEAAAYFCCLEAVQNAAKHSGAAHDPGRRSWARTGPCSSSVEDDGIGFDPRTTAAGDRAGEHARPGRVGRRHPRRSSRPRPGHPDPWPGCPARRGG